MKNHSCDSCEIYLKCILHKSGIRLPKTAECSSWRGKEKTKKGRKK